ncbi:MAG: hypothetical protein KGO96_07005 [Elusimicrobia bacterium]|nr:hypothetical protein [Elusimicrobiota bacterium]
MDISTLYGKKVKLKIFFPGPNPWGGTWKGILQKIDLDPEKGFMEVYLQNAIMPNGSPFDKGLSEQNIPKFPLHRVDFLLPDLE